MKPSATLSLLQELYRERLALFDRHIKGAQAIADYEFNNTYQYVVGREEHHLQWVRKAIEDLGGTVDTTISALAVPAGKGKKREEAVLQDDARQQVRERGTDEDADHQRDDQRRPGRPVRQLDDSRVDDIGRDRDRDRHDDRRGDRR